MNGEQAYGLWLLVIINSLVFIIFAFRLAKREEAEMLARFGEEYRRYKDAVPAFLLRFGDSTLTFPR